MGPPGDPCSLGNPTRHRFRSAHTNCGTYQETRPWRDMHLSRDDCRHPGQEPARGRYVRPVGQALAKPSWPGPGAQSGKRFESALFLRLNPRTLCEARPEPPFPWVPSPPFRTVILVRHGGGTRDSYAVLSAVKHQYSGRAGREFPPPQPAALNASRARGIPPRGASPDRAGSADGRGRCSARGPRQRSCRRRSSSKWRRSARFPAC